MFQHTALRWCLGLAVLGVTSLTLAQAPATTFTPTQEAIQNAARQDKYNYILFWKQEDAATQAMRQAVQTCSSSNTGKARVYAVQITDPIEKPVVDQFGVSGSPLPLVLAVAPNGAVTGGFPQKVTDAQLAGALVSPSMAASLKEGDEVELLGEKFAVLALLPETGTVDDAQQFPVSR